MSEVKMGFSGEIKKGMVEAFKDAIDDVKMKRRGELKDSQGDEFAFVDWFFGDSTYNISLSKMGGVFCLTYKKYSDKFSDTEEFAQFVAPFMEPQDILFDADSNYKDDFWGFRIREDGSVVELENQIVETDVIYYPKRGN